MSSCMLQTSDKDRLRVYPSDRFLLILTTKVSTAKEIEDHVIYMQIDNKYLATNTLELIVSLRL
jgi:hypothetical protein